MKEHWQKRALRMAALGLAALAVLAVVYLSAPGAGVGIPCPLHAFTGLYCSGCGASRALRSFLHGEFYQALRFNALVTLLFPFALLYAAASALSYIRRGYNQVDRMLPSGPLWWLLAAVLLFGILRNLPWFSFLAPTCLG